MRAMTRQAWIVGTAFFFLAAAAAQSGREVEIVAEPSHRLLLQNNYVRVFSVEIAPQATSELHRHRHDYVFVTLGAGDLTDAVAGRTAARLKLQDGETEFVSGGFAHQVRNLANTPLRRVTIELLQDEKARKSPPAKWEDERGLQILEGGTQDILFVKDGVRVSEVGLQSGGMLPAEKKAAPRLLVAVSEVELRGHGGSAVAKHLRAGEVWWIAGGVAPALMNVGRSAEKFIMLEFH